MNPSSLVFIPAMSSMVGVMSTHEIIAPFVIPFDLMNGELMIQGNFSPGSYTVVFAPGKAMPLSEIYIIIVLSAFPDSFRYERSLPIPWSTLETD